MGKCRSKGLLHWNVGIIKDGYLVKRRTKVWYLGKCKYHEDLVRGKVQT